MNLIERSAVAFLRERGYTVLVPDEPPTVGSIWRPVKARTPRTHSRCVLDTTPNTVLWAAVGVSKSDPKDVALATWRRWVRRTRAVSS